MRGHLQPTYGHREVLAAHMMGCMTEAIQEGKGQEKIDEIMKLLEKMD